MSELYEVENHNHFELLVSYDCRVHQQVEIVYIPVISYLYRLVMFSYILQCPWLPRNTFHFDL